MLASTPSSPFARGLRLAVALTLLLGVLFFFYSSAEQHVDQVNAQRYDAHHLMDELRQSSQELTRMARSYVATGDGRYQRSYRAIVARRDGRPVAPADAEVVSDTSWEAPQLGADGPALLERMQSAGFSAHELQQLAQAKAASDALTQLELRVMAQTDALGPDEAPPGPRQRLRDELFDDTYSQAKQAVMRPIGLVEVALEQRLQSQLTQATTAATWLHRALVLVAVVLLWALWQTVRSLRRLLGGSPDDIHAQMTRLGAGDFSDHPALGRAAAGSVLGGLARTQRRLKTLGEAQHLADAKLQRLNGLYAALSQCRHAILRSTDQSTLFTQLCQTAVQDGGMRLAWVGVPNERTRLMEPAAAFGEGSSGLSALRVPMDTEHPTPVGASGWVLGNDQPYWCQRFMEDERLRRWWPQGERFGWVGMAALPLHRDGQVVAVFYVYASSVDAFDSQIQNLLLEMSADVDHALRLFDQEAERLHSQKKDELGSFLLQRLVSDAPLSDILNDVVMRLQTMMPGVRGSILLVDAGGEHLRLGAAPSLPDFFNAAADGLAIGPTVGSCGAAVATGQRVITQDIASDPNWVSFKALAVQAGLASCWSEPILSGSGEVLGSFALYHATPRVPQREELDLIDLVAHLCAIAIERKDAEVQLQLKARVYEQGTEAIVITDRARQIVRVNRAFTRISGYTEAEVRGRNPRMLSSGRQDAAFYQAMWAAIAAQDHWQGELWNRRKDGSIYPEWLSITALRDRDGEVINYVGIASDISQRKEDEAKIRHLADFDALTGLPNRRLLEDRVTTALSQAQRTGQPLALMFVDLDRFKNVNDSLGHHVGDELLVQVAQRLKAVLRAQDTVGRLGGDEFVLLCLDTDAAGAAHVAAKLLESASQRFEVAQQELSVTLSVGIALYPQDGDTFATLSMRADTAMYRAKQAGRNAYRFFTAEMQAQSSRMLQLENALSRALELDQLHLVYQPQIGLLSGQLVGAEALLRWDHPTLGRVSPAEFIPVAEDSGLILSIGEWVLRTALAQLRDWRDAGLAVPVMAVNLSAIQFRQKNLPDLVTRILAEYGLAPRCLELELTEGVAMSDPLEAIGMMSQLHQRGVQMSIDDFGTGYSSLSYLKQFQVYKLKIDQSFVRDLTDDADDKAIVVAVIALARSMGFQTIAEGVETDGQLEFLREQGCDEAQGYHFSKPVPALEFESFCRQHDVG